MSRIALTVVALAALFCFALPKTADAGPPHHHHHSSPRVRAYFGTGFYSPGYAYPAYPAYPYYPAPHAYPAPGYYGYPYPAYPVPVPAPVYVPPRISIGVGF